MSTVISGVSLLEGFVPNPAELFEWAVATIPWDDRIQARKTASVGVPYNYAGLTYEQKPFPVEIERVRSAIAKRIGFDTNNCLLNYYPDGSSRMGFHSDSATGLAPGSGVAIVSLGAPRNLRFRRISRLEERFNVLLPPGSLLFMESHVQGEWHHAIPRTSRPPPRISLTFRQVLPEPV